MTPARAVHDLLDLTGTIVLVTGAGRHIGRGIARRLAEAGADVAVHFHTSRDGAAGTVAAIEALGRRAVAVQADVTAPLEVEQLFDAVETALGPVTALVNNAGIYPVAPLLDLPAPQWDEMLQANLRSAFLCTQAAARRLVAKGRPGAIVNVTSISAHNPVPGHAHYCASKAAMESLTQVSAAELGAHGIRVNAVAPGVIMREGLERDWPDGVARYQRAVPLGRLGEVDDVGDACLFLLSRAARWITGTSLRVDGGVLVRQAY
jgi:NAD(P)-dependent dehydrogenase (short-subunit alcohol dehydrogenase family)